MHKKILLIICWIAILLIISIGLYKILVLYNTTCRIETEGIRTSATITKKWRSKCGSGYGNSATFVVNIENKELTFTSTCNVPNEVQVGEKYYVKYLKEDPSKNLILFKEKAR